MAKSARDAVEAFKNDDIQGLESAITEEWEARKTLSDAVCPVRIGQIMDRLKNAGVSSMKLCGAGGGGSMICLAPKDKHESLIALAEEFGLSHLEASLDDRGVLVEER